MTSDSLAAMSNESQDITVGSRTYKCGPWQMRDYAHVERVVRGERLNELIKGSRFAPMMQDPEIMSGAVAQVQNATIGLREMLTCQSARTELLIANLLRNDPTVTEDDVRSLSPIAARELFDFMSELSGLTEKEADADPTISSIPTEGEA